MPNQSDQQQLPAWAAAAIRAAERKRDVRAQLQRSRDYGLKLRQRQRLTRGRGQR